MSRVEAFYHIVITTKNRQMTITEEHKRELYGYMWGILKRKRCVLLRINGIANHIHILTSLNPNIALSELMRDLKRSSSEWLKHNPIFPYWGGWESEYAAFTCSKESLSPVIEYIKSQEIHHYGSPEVEDF